MKLGLALARKELREHWVVLGLVLALDAFMLLGILIQAAEKGGRFTGLVQSVESLGTLTALVAANRFFVREYAGRTQLFLEVLPIGRPRVWATKWLLGCAYIGALTLAAWFASWRRALRTEMISTHDALLVLLSIGSFMFVVWSFASMAGMLGRYRYTAWIALLTVVILSIERGRFSLGELPVMGLLGEPTAMARGPLDWTSLLEAWMLSACFAAASATLAVAGSGAIASTLAQKMTARERVFLFVASVVGIFAYSTVDAGRSKVPFTVADAVYATNAGIRVGVLRRGEIEESAAAHMAQTIADDLAGMLHALGLQTAPPVFVLPNRSLDPTVVERAALEHKDGIVLRVAPGIALSRLRMKVLHDALAEHTRGRALREDRHVLLDGFATWWALRADESERARRWLRAAAARGPVTAATLTRWEETEEHLGECVADGLAFATFDVLARKLGSKAALAFAQALFSRPPNDFRVLFERTPAALLQQAGITWSVLAAELENNRRAVIRQHASELSVAARRSAAISVQQTARRGTQIEVGLAGADAYWALYTVIGPWAAWHSSLSRLDVRSARATLPLSAPRGARVLVALETDDAFLGCPVRVTSERITLP
jgi:hypothetical protein